MDASAVAPMDSPNASAATSNVRDCSSERSSRSPFSPVPPDVAQDEVRAPGLVHAVAVVKSDSPESSASRSTFEPSESSLSQALMTELFGDDHSSDQAASEADSRVELSEDAIDWDGIARRQPSQCVKDVISRREAIFAEQRECDDPILQARALDLNNQHVVTHNASFPGARTAYFFEQWSSFCDDLQVPPFPITPDLVCLFRIRILQKWSASTTLANVSILDGMLKATRDVWVGCEWAAARSSRGLESTLRSYRPIKDCVAVKNPRDRKSPRKAGANTPPESKPSKKNSASSSASLLQSEASPEIITAQTPDATLLPRTYTESPHARNLRPRALRSSSKSRDIPQSLDDQSDPLSRASSPTPSASDSDVSVAASDRLTSAGAHPLDIAGAPFVGQSFASGDAFKAYYIKEVASQLGVSVVLSYSSWRCLRFICNRRTTSKCPYAVGLVKSEGTEAWIISDSSVLRHNHGPSVKKRKNSELRPSNRGAASSIKRDSLAKKLALDSDNSVPAKKRKTTTTTRPTPSGSSTQVVSSSRTTDTSDSPPTLLFGSPALDSSATGKSETVTFTRESSTVRPGSFDDTFIVAIKRFLNALSPSLAPVASKLVDAGVKDPDALHHFIALEDEAVRSLAEGASVPIFPRQLLRAGLRRLRESGWAVESLYE